MKQIYYILSFFIFSLLMITSATAATGLQITRDRTGNVTVDKPYSFNAMAEDYKWESHDLTAEITNDAGTSLLLGLELFEGKVLDVNVQAWLDNGGGLGVIPSNSLLEMYVDGVMVLSIETGKNDKREFDFYVSGEQSRNLLAELQSGQKVWLLLDRKLLVAEWTLTGSMKAIDQAIQFGIDNPQHDATQIEDDVLEPVSDQDGALKADEDLSSQQLIFDETTRELKDKYNFKYLASTSASANGKHTENNNLLYKVNTVEFGQSQRIIESKLGIPDMEIKNVTFGCENSNQAYTYLRWGNIQNKAPIVQMLLNQNNQLKIIVIHASAENTFKPGSLSGVISPEYIKAIELGKSSMYDITGGEDSHAWVNGDARYPAVVEPVYYGHTGYNRYYHYTFSYFGAGYKVFPPSKAHRKTSIPDIMSISEERIDLECNDDVDAVGLGQLVSVPPLWFEGNF